MATVPALKQLPLRGEIRFMMPALRTDEPVRPAKILKILETFFLRLKLLLKPEEIDLCIRAHVYPHFMCYSYMSAYVYIMIPFVKQYKLVLYALYIKIIIYQLPRSKLRGITISPLTLGPFPPMGAREVVAHQVFPAPFGGRMSKGHGVPARTEYVRGKLKGAFASSSLYFSRKPLLPRSKLRGIL
jgi:hypothetical protein